MNTQCTRPVQQMCFVQCCVTEQHGGVYAKGLITSYTHPSLTWPHTATPCHCVQLNAWPIWPVHTAQEVGAHLNQHSLPIGYFILACTDVCAIYTHWIANLWRKYIQICYANILDNALLKPQDLHYPRGVHTSPRTRYRSGVTHRLTHFGPWPLGRQWVLLGLTHTP